MCVGGTTNMSGLQPGSMATVSPNPQAQGWMTQAFDMASRAAQQPFMTYGQSPEQYVAQINPMQQAAINNLYGAQGTAAPWYQAAGGALGQGQQALGAGMGAYQQAMGMFPAAQQAIGAGQGYMGAGAGMIGQAPSYFGQGQQYYGQGAGLAQQAAGQRVADQGVAAISDPYYRQALTGTQGAMSAPGGLAAANPYLGGGAGMLGSAAQMTAPVDQAAIQSFMSPYMKQVTDPTMQYLKQQQEQAMAGQTGNAIRSGAFGGDRASLAAAQLAGQQQLAQGQTLGNLLQQGYGQALGAAFQQQGMTQADLARQLQAGQAMGQLGQVAGGLRTSDLARQLQGAGQIGQIGTAQRGAYEQQQAMQQADLARQIQASQLMGQFGAGMGQLGSGIAGAGAQMGNVGVGMTGSGAQLGQLGTGMGQLGAGMGNIGGQFGQLGGQYGTLGSGLTSSQLAAAQGLLGGGTLQQQTSQAGIDAMINNFNQMRANPYQQAQFLANIAGALGPAMGSTQYNQQAFQFQNPFASWSDPRLKEGVGAARGYADGGAPEPVGQLYDGQDIYRYRLNDPVTGQTGAPQLGLMAPEVQQNVPDAVGNVGGLQTVDYARATDDAADIGKGLGAARLGGGVTQPGDYADGGAVSIADLITAQRGMYGRKPMGGIDISGTPGGPTGVIPTGQITAARLVTPTAAPDIQQPQQAGGDKMKEALSLLGRGVNVASAYKKSGDKPDYLDIAKAGFADPFKAKGGSVEEDRVLDESGIPLTPLQASKLVVPDIQKTEIDKKRDSAGNVVDTIGNVVSTGSKIAQLGSAAASLAPTLMSLSDPRVKTGVRPAFATDGGVDDNKLNAERLYQYYTEKGASPNEAVLLTSAAGSESSYNPTVIHDKGTGYGLFGHRLDRLDAMRKYAGDQYPSWQKQADFALNELRSRPEGRGLAGAQEFMSPEELTRRQLHFERPAGYTQKHPEQAYTYGKRLSQTRNILGLSGADGANFDLSKVRPEDREKVALDPAVARQGLGAMEAYKPMGFSERLEKDPESIILPALQGLGAVVSSRSANPIGAIMEGVGTGAGAYLGQRNTEQQRMLEQRKQALEEMLKPREVGAAETEAGAAKLRAETERKEFERKENVGKTLAEIAAGQGAVPPAKTGKEVGSPTTGTPTIIDNQASSLRAEAARLEKMADAALLDPQQSAALRNQAIEKSRQADMLERESPARKTEELETKGFAEEYNDTQRMAQQADVNIGNIKEASRLLESPGLYTGPGGERVAQATGVAAALPIIGEYARGPASAAQQFNALTKQMLLDSSGGSLGAGISNEDRKVIGATKPSIETGYDANKEILFRMEKLERRKQEIAQFQRDWMKKNNRPLDNQYRQELSVWAKAHPMFSETERQSAGVKPESAKPIPKDKSELIVGETYKSRDGRIGVWDGNKFVVR